MPTSLRMSWIRSLTAAAAATLVLTTLPSSAVAAELPAPGLSRSASPDGALTVGEPVDITLTARNVGTGVAFDPWVVECVATGLTVSAISPAATVTPAGCAAGGTRIDWKLDDLGPGATTPLRYTALPQSVTVAGTLYSTHGRISVLSEPFDRTHAGSAVPEGISERSIQSSRSLTYGLPRVTQTASPSNPAPGETVTFTLVSTVPAGVGLANAVVRDLMPTGLDVAGLQTLDVSCVDSSGVECALHDTAGEHHVNHERLVTWTMGHLSPAATDRTITVVLSIPVQAGTDAVLRNRSGMQWSDHPSIVGRAGFRGGAVTSIDVEVGGPTLPPTPVPSSPGTSDPVPSSPVPSASVPSSPVPSAPALSSSVPGFAVPSNPAPSGPVSDGPSAGAPTEQVSPSGTALSDRSTSAPGSASVGSGGSGGSGSGGGGGGTGSGGGLASTGVDVGSRTALGLLLLLSGGALAAIRLRSSARSAEHR